MMQYAISFRGAVMSAAAIAAVASIAVPAPSIAGQPGAVVVTATTAEWSGAVSRELESRLAALVDPPLQHRRVPTGVVSVRFRTDENGAPRGIEIARTSGSAALDSIGKRVHEISGGSSRAAQRRHPESRSDERGEPEKSLDQREPRQEPVT